MLRTRSQTPPQSPTMGPCIVFNHRLYDGNVARSQPSHSRSSVRRQLSKRCKNAMRYARTPNSSLYRQQRRPGRRCNGIKTMQQASDSANPASTVHRVYQREVPVVPYLFQRSLATSFHRAHSEHHCQKPSRQAQKRFDGDDAT